MMMLSTTTTTLITQVTGLIFFRGIGCGSVEFEDFMSFFLAVREQPWILGMTTEGLPPSYHDGLSGLQVGSGEGQHLRFSIKKIMKHCNVCLGV